MKAILGDTQWIESHHGRLRWHNRMVQLAQGVWAKLRENSAATPARQLTATQIVPPDTAICIAALALAESVSAPYLYNHTLRSYFFAQLLDPSTAPVDDEAFFVAVVLHDLGLTQRYLLPADGQQHCFTAPAATEAFSLARQHGWSDVRARLVADAISLHLNVVVRAEHGREAQLVRLGSGADVVGQGLSALPTHHIGSVVARYPRLNMKREIRAVLENESKLRPRSRVGFLCHGLQFAKLIERNRFFSE